MADQRVLILDFGSQFTQLIARRVRQLRVYCEIHPHSMSAADVEKFAPSAIILSGGPASVYGANAPKLDRAILDRAGPLLGICYGMQLMTHELGGKVMASSEREYGRALVTRTRATTGKADALLHAFDSNEPFEVWASHGDRIEALPPDFVAIASSDNAPFTAMAHKSKPVFGVQFHPEVAHTPRGIKILEAFLFDVAGLSPSWTMGSFLDTQIKKIRAEIPKNDKVICAFSGGVDSSVVAALLGKAIGDQVQCIFVDNGVLRRGEVEQVKDIFGRALHLPLKVVDARAMFMDALKGIIDPEKKRKIIGGKFIEVFEHEAKSIPGANWLAQGTLYPDVIESVSFKGPSAVIKSHHNVGGLPERMKMKLVEPLRELFKDEVRLLGAELGLPDHLCYRQPFPGPGLAVRILGEVTQSRCDVLRQADAIVEEEIIAGDYYRKVWQSFAVLLPVRSVGVMGDDRTYDETIAIRSVDSTDGMTADWSRLPYEMLGRMSSRIINEVRGINRVVYDVSSKPPATIEWE